MASNLHIGNAAIVTYAMTDTLGAPVTTSTVTGSLKTSAGVEIASVAFALSGSAFVGEITAATTAGLTENTAYLFRITATGPAATIDVNYIAKRLEAS